MASASSGRSLFPNRYKAAAPKGPAPPAGPEPVPPPLAEPAPGPPPSVTDTSAPPLVKPSAAVSARQDELPAEQVDKIIRSSGMFDTSVGSVEVEDPYNSGKKVSMPLYYVPSPRVEFVAVVGSLLKEELDQIKDLKSSSTVSVQSRKIKSLPAIHFSKWFAKHNLLVKTYLEDVVRALMAVLNARTSAREEELNLIEQESSARATSGPGLGSTSGPELLDLDSVLGDSALSEPAAGVAPEEPPADEEELDTRVLDELLTAYQKSIQTLVRTVGEYVRAETNLEDDFADAERANVEQFYNDGSGGSLDDELHALKPLRTVTALQERRSSRTATSLVESSMLSEKQIGEQLFALLKTNQTAFSAIESAVKQQHQRTGQAPSGTRKVFV